MRRRIVTLYLILAVIVSSVVATVIYRYSSDTYLREVENSLTHEVALVSKIIEEEQAKSSNLINDEFLKGVAQLIDNKNDKTAVKARRLTVIESSGKVLADSEAVASEMANHLDRPEVKTALSGQLGTDIRKSSTTGENFIYVAYYSPSLKEVIRVAASIKYIDEIRNTILLYSVIAVLVGLVVSSFIALFLSGYAIRPVARLVSKYGSAIENKTSFSEKGDEIGQLSLTLSSMTSQIEAIIMELKDRNARVDTIINSMGSGLIAVDRFMRIITINPIAAQLFGVDDSTQHIGTPLVQIIRNRLLNDLLWKSILNNQSFNEELHIYQGGKRILAIHISPIYPMDSRAANSGALAYINDITQVRKLEEVRSEFVSNVTHELKTPLTSIRGFVETLKNGAIHDDNVAEKFLDIIDLEADRLSQLINDILELSEIEGMKREHDFENFKLFPLIKEVESILMNSAKEKGVHFEISTEGDLSLKANRNRIKQLLINLMDNAIKYNKPNGAVWVWTEEGEGNIKIHVKDTGIGIPQDKQTRIFERFYRVDKGRSRQMGGTGLGLSIVKHIANLYNGSISVSSEEGKGSEFVVTLPTGRQD